MNTYAQEEVSRRIQDQTSMLTEEELKESTKFITILEVAMENREERANFEIFPRQAWRKRIEGLKWWEKAEIGAAMYGTSLGLIFDVIFLVRT